MLFLVDDSENGDTYQGNLLSWQVALKMIVKMETLIKETYYP